MATINDIAKNANVSTSTVSHVVNKTRYVSPELVERVEKAISELDYLPNFVVKKAKPHINHTDEQYILLITTDKKSNFQKQIKCQIDLQLQQTGYSLIPIDCSSDIEKLTVFFDYLLSRSALVAGVIAFPDDKDLLTEKILSNLKLPVIILGREVKNYYADTIISDTFEGANLAVTHLIKNGHELIAFLGNSKNRTPQRLAGYKKALKDYSIVCNDDYIFSNLSSSQDVYDCLDTLLSGSHALSAVFAANYSIIIPLLKYIRAHNIDCPGDLSIVTFNNFEWAPLHTPAITTIEQNTDELGRLAVDTLLKRIKNGEIANSPALKDVYEHLSLPTKINVRESTCGIGRGPFGEKAASSSDLVLTDREMEQIRRMHLTAAISFHYAGKAWMKLHEKGIKDIFENLGISLIATTDAHFDPALQCKQLESLRILEPDIIIAIPTDNHKTSSAFKKIVADKKSRLILITNVPDGLSSKDYITCVSVNERSHGRNMGRGLGEYMTCHNLKYAGLVTHDADFYATTQRDNAAIQTLAEEYGNIHVCGSISFRQEKDVYQETSSFMNRYPETQAFYVSWDGPALEVMSALSDINRTDIAIVTGDLDYADAMNMAKGGMIKMISAQCPFEQGQSIALAAASSMLKKWVPSFIGIEPISVTPDNLLKSWKKIFKEDPSFELREAFRSNANYVETKEE